MFEYLIMIVFNIYQTIKIFSFFVYKNFRKIRERD